jgi:hypothetical protein
MQKKVIFDHTLLRSKQPMAEAIYRLQTQEENFFFSRHWLRSLKPAPPAPKPVNHEVYMDGLLRPPDIDSVKIDDFDGETCPIIFISAAQGVGKVNISVSVLDERGNVVSRGPALYIGAGTEWAFSLWEPVESGTPVDVSVRVIDCVGGARVEHFRLAIP